MSEQISSRTTMDTPATRVLVVIAQLLAMAALGFGLLFVLHTTGGTLFLFSSGAPLLVFVSSATVVGLAINRFRRRHSLFAVETRQPGQTIIRQGDIGDCIYFIQSGEVEVVRDESGREVPVARLSAGQYFGEMALLSSQPRNATVRALTTVKLSVLGKGNFLSMLRALPTTQKDVLKTVQERALAQQRP